MEAGAVVKGQGKPNDLMERIQKDPNFAAVHDKLENMMDPKLFVGRAPQQVDEFLADFIGMCITSIGRAVSGSVHNRGWRNDRSSWCPRFAYICTVHYRRNDGI